MSSLRTEITEIVTGLAMLGGTDPGDELARRPAELLNVGAPHFDRLAAAWQAGAERASFEAAWANGQAFLGAAGGLRGRAPQRVEWKGEHRAPDFELVPADLRVDHVYLVSCKYRSKVLMNPSPPHLFDRSLASRPPDAGRLDWYAEVAPEAYQQLYEQVRLAVAPALPARVGELERPHRSVLKAALRRSWPAAAADAHADFVRQVSVATAQRWSARAGDLRRREVLLWRLLRLQGAPYFLLGVPPEGEPLRLRVDTPWDWRQAFRLREFAIEAGQRGQPEVRWRALVDERASGWERLVEGHVEVRWSHGRFCGVPEAKVYLDTPHSQVAGYTAIA